MMRLEELVRLIQKRCRTEKWTKGMRKALGEAQKNGKRAVLMRVKSDNTTKFVAVPFAGA